MPNLVRALAGALVAVLACAAPAAAVPGKPQLLRTSSSPSCAQDINMPASMPRSVFLRDGAPIQSTWGMASCTPGPADAGHTLTCVVYDINDAQYVTPPSDGIDYSLYGFKLHSGRMSGDVGGGPRGLVGHGHAAARRVGDRDGDRRGRCRVRRVVGRPAGRLTTQNDKARVTLNGAGAPGARTFTIAPAGRSRRHSGCRSARASRATGRRSRAATRSALPE